METQPLLKTSDHMRLAIKISDCLLHWGPSIIFCKAALALFFYTLYIPFSTCCLAKAHSLNESDVFTERLHYIGTVDLMAIGGAAMAFITTNAMLEDFIANITSLKWNGPIGDPDFRRIITLRLVIILPLWIWQFPVWFPALGIKVGSLLLHFLPLVDSWHEEGILIFYATSSAAMLVYMIYSYVASHFTKSPKEGTFESEEESLSV
ncbi:AGL367Cp [Eremothecium gossypii ATCC 10895]|uniref:AGL367Cp n=1 Tax=Eremothecium gossypii (strain ATCC 10895 / CBS 109.51 / FGSC 9923 / NRRL Y-1056) TaxID=284811 RepID=Q751Q7_EREGS|nr:AGL367Cp [Eremothecium gossypii ATCC 10895]AAS54123.1 AGL367Cp [Eremothecium gossypii ATCC 10895]AEY98449.1 FAGL367Cp [Eremothecium gossypii FDAG1]